MGTDETRMKALRAYYMDIEQELVARKAFPKSSQNKKRIEQCEKELEVLREMMVREE